MNPLDDFEADSIDAQAAGWLVRNRYDSSRHNRKAFKQWLRDPEHARAYRQLEHLWQDLEALKQAANPLAPVVQRSPRRLVMIAAVGMACAVMTASPEAHGLFLQSADLRASQLPAGTSSAD